MSMRDPEDHRLTRQIVEQQQQVSEIATQMNRGMSVANMSQLPTNIAVNFPDGANVRYLVVVEVRDLTTGRTTDAMVELFEDVPLLTDAVRNMAVDSVMNNFNNWRSSEPIDHASNIGPVGVRIISASRRG